MTGGDRSSSRRELTPPERIYFTAPRRACRAPIGRRRGPKGKRRGLYATRAPHRPNQLSLSCVSIQSVDASGGRVVVRGLDLIDGTPVLDIKPYIAYCDAFQDARSGWLDELEGSADHAAQPDHLDYWPPPPHLS